ncbi:MAG TPA: formate--tetrahydrofolate ligase [Candidatus Nanoarchaeia archaeon]|nr:formate--tetrahydrofolate ligase [Candidatus Nanoarchaeia archaeon]
MSNIEIAQKARLEPIHRIAEKLGIADIYPYGPYIVKVNQNSVTGDRSGKLILITAMTPTKSGEGKSTITVGLGQGLAKMGKKSMICMREPSLGPCFGMKGGACGGGYSQILPMEEINLHFTGDIAAVAAANNLLAAMIDNHILQGNELGIDPTKVVWRRSIDMNDRTLRNIYVGVEKEGHLRKDKFDITAASEIMAILCLSTDMVDLKTRLGKIIVAYTKKSMPVYCNDLKAVGAMAVLLKHAIHPNLVQSIEGVPAFVHGGPFANIAHGCSSLIATRLALRLADYVVTEAGFGSDLGAEKFFDIKCRVGKLHPNAVVIVATIKALKYHGNGDVKAGLPNLEKHIEIIRKFKLPVVVALNHFSDNNSEDIEIVRTFCEASHVCFAVADAYTKGGYGCTDLAAKVLSAIDDSDYAPLYPLRLTIKEKIHRLGSQIYGAAKVAYTAEAESKIRDAERLGYGNIPICMAKTQYSLSDDPLLLARPSGFTVTVQDVRISAGAGFLVVLTGSVMTMPGLPKHPNAENMDIDEAGRISGLF